MSKQSSRITLYLEPHLGKALKRRAIEESRRTNSLVVDAIQAYLGRGSKNADTAQASPPVQALEVAPAAASSVPDFLTRREYDALKDIVGSDAIDNSIGILCFAIGQRRLPLNRDEAASLLAQWNEQKLPHRRVALEIDEVLDRGLAQGSIVQDERGQIWSGATLERDWYKANEGMRPSLASKLMTGSNNGSA